MYTAWITIAIPLSATLALFYTTSSKGYLQGVLEEVPQGILNTTAPEINTVPYNTTLLNTLGAEARNGRSTQLGFKGNK